MIPTIIGEIMIYNPKWECKEVYQLTDERNKIQDTIKSYNELPIREYLDKVQSKDYAKIVRRLKVIRTKLVKDYGITFDWQYNLDLRGKYATFSS